LSSQAVANWNIRVKTWTTDQIVDEVLRRLRADTQPVETAPVETAPAGRLVIDDRVVSLAVLEGRLEGIREVHVAKRSVVTPAVKDELRQRGITLRRSTEDKTISTAKSLLNVASTSPDIDTANLGIPTDDCRRYFDERTCLGKLRELLTAARRLLVLTRQPESFAAAASQNPDAVATAAGSEHALGRIRDNPAINVIAVCPTDLPRADLRRALARFQ